MEPHVEARQSKVTARWTFLSLHLYLRLITVINDWAKILDKKGQVDTFILDFEKAFDTPPHELLKSKLFSYGIGGKTLEWINAFCASGSKG